MSKYFTMTNFWIFVGTIIVCTAPWLALAAIVAFFVAMYFCTPSSPAEPDVGDPDSTIEWPAIEFPNVAAVIDEEKAVAEARAAKARYEDAKKSAQNAKRTATIIKIVFGIGIVGVLAHNYLSL